MKSVSLSEAKAKLSSLIRLVERGEVVVILSHGKPVARLCAPIAGDRGTDEAILADLERRGIVRRGKHPPSLDFLKLPLPRSKGGKSLLDALLEEREEGR